MRKKVDTYFFSFDYGNYWLSQTIGVRKNMFGEM